MQRRKKQLLGLASLALVIGMTAIACALPTPGAWAADEDAEVPGGDHLVTGEGDDGATCPGDQCEGVGIKVIVTEQTPSDYAKIDINSPSSDSSIYDSDVQINFSYINTTPDRLTATLRRADGTTINVPIPSDSCSNGTCSFKFHIPDEFKATQGEGAMSYQLTVSDASGRGDDNVRFVYRAAQMTSEDKYDKNENPIVNVILSDQVVSAIIQVYDENNNPVFVKDGKEVPMVLDVDKFRNGNIGAEIALLMQEFGAKPGRYTAVLVARNAKGEIISLNTAKIGYRIPEIPGTGINMLKELNISTADYVVTGMIAFGIVTLFAIFLIVRRNKEQQ